MLTRLYVDNYRALVNNELVLDRRSLIMGANGSGKSTFGDVLVAIKLLLFGRFKTDDIFPTDTLTRWQSARQQRFEIDAIGAEGSYRYELVIEHRETTSVDAARTRIILESLTLNSQPLFKFVDGVVHLFRDDHSTGPEYPFDWERSALGPITSRHDNQKLTWFLRWMQALTVLRPDPPQMIDLIEKDDFLLVPNASNFSAWYHTASSGDKRRDRELHDALTRVLPGFEALNFEFAGPSRWLLRADFSHAGVRLGLRFTELSEGQRQLILLYAVLIFLLQQNITVFLDEPDNFVSLDEIQPWLLTVTDTVDDGVGQAILISHHPEIFDQWAVTHGLVAIRDGCGPVRIRRFESVSDSSLIPSEAIARGWIEQGNTEPARIANQ